MAAPRPGWRLWLFRVLAGLAAAFSLVGGYWALAPWLPVGCPTRCAHPQLHLWHQALIQGVDTLLVGLPYALLSMREGRPVLLAQYLAAVIAGSVVIQIAFYGPIGLAVLVPAAPGILALAAYPRPRLLLERGAPAVRWRLVVVLSVLTTALLAAWAIHLISANAASLGSRELQWGTEVQHVFVLGVAALAISSRRPGWEVLAVLVGAAGIFLWAAALTVPSQPGNWGTTVGILAFVVGLAFLSLVIVPRLMGGRRRPYAP